MTKIIDGKKIRDKILTDIKKEVVSLPFQPVFCDVLVGEDPSSMQYVRMKAKTAESVGIKFHNASFPSAISTEELMREIKTLNKMPNMCGIIVQLPLPPSIDKRMILDSIDPELDVDCLGRVAGEKFYSGQDALGLPTALACMKLLDSVGINLREKKIVVLGRGDLVGKPVAALLNFRGLNVEVVSSKTENKEIIIKKADVVISGIGKGKYVTGDMIKEGAVLIDAGTSESLGHSPTGEPDGAPPSGQERASIVGDIDVESMKDIAGFVSPVPGGVGPVTVAMLLNNVLQVAKKKQNE